MTNISDTPATPIAIVTGASRGLGRSTALKLAESGSDVILTYLSNAEQAQAVVGQIEALGRRAVALRLDVADSKSFEAFAAEVKAALAQGWRRERFDYLVNNAGTGVHAAFDATTGEQFDSMVAIHLKGTYFLTQKLLPLINDGGRIVNISSGLTRFSLPGYSAYAAMKGGIEVLTRYLAKELGLASHHRQHFRAWCDRNRLRRWRGARQRPAERLRRVADRARPGRVAGRYRRRDRGLAVERQRLGQCAEDRGVGRDVHLGRHNGACRDG